MPDQTPEDYARSQLVEYLVDKGIERELATRHVRERIREFTSITTDGCRTLLVQYDGRIWPTFNAGDTNQHALALGDRLWTEIPDEIRNRPRGAPPRDGDPDSPYAGRVDDRVRSAV